MAKKVTMKKASKSRNAEPANSKAELLREWWTTKPPGQRWKEVKAEIKALVASSGHVFNETSDYLGFLAAGKKTGKIQARSMGAQGAAVKGSGGVSLRQFAMLTANIDPAALKDAIAVISQVGGVDNAKILAAKWASLCDSIGEAAARKALDVIG